MAKSGTIGAMQAQRMMPIAAGEIGFAATGVIRDRQSEHVSEVMLHLVFPDGVEREKAEAQHFDRHDCVSPELVQAGGGEALPSNATGRG